MPSREDTSRSESESPLDILVVDDLEQVHEILVRKLTGHRVRSAYNLRQARAELTAAEPDALILDLQLPSGCSLRLLEDRRIAVPTLVLTAFAEGATRAKAESLGVLAYLDKSAETYARILAHVANAIRVVRWRSELDAIVAAFEAGPLTQRRYEETVRLIERSLLRNAVDRSASKADAARRLGIARSTLHRKLRD